MRDLSSTQLTAAQKKPTKPAVRVVLVSGETTYTFYNTSGDHRIVAMEHKEMAFAANATIVLDNRDKYFSTLSLYGYTATISWGLKTSAGLEYSAAAPLQVVVQNLDSSPGRLYCSLFCLGEMSLLAEDKADTTLLPTTQTLNDLIEDTLDATLASYIEANGYKAYTVNWDTGYDDGLIDSFVPEESVRVAIGTSRLAFIRRCIDFTNDVIRYEADGKFHILLPTTSGDTYDYEYEYPLLDEHVFVSKTQMARLTSPNWVYVFNDDYASDPTGEGNPGKDTTAYALRPIKLPIKLQKLADNDEADNLAIAILAKLRMNAKTAEIVVPMNCGQEIWDYVKITDTREGSTQTGNVGAITRHYAGGRYNMTIKMGGWTTMKEFASRWEVYGGGGDDIASPPPAWPLEVDWFYAHTLYADTLQALTSLQLGAGETVDIIRDENNMASDDEDALATQKSIKAYVDALKTYVDGLGHPDAMQVIVTSVRALNTTYSNVSNRAVIMTVIVYAVGVTNPSLKAFVDDTESNVTNEVAAYLVAYQTDIGAEGGILSCTFVVPHGYYYRVDGISTLLQWTEWPLAKGA